MRFSEKSEPHKTGRGKNSPRTSAILATGVAIQQAASCSVQQKQAIL
ncbi:MAG: hypothetical protein HN842_07210 [Gammaproteobacteria bacterium]|nr:hypothetical protein [Gammaproteobacteria bacterium]MBT7307988.1 hypothetical protein [Gammaproteobacteria bacterium]